MKNKKIVITVLMFIFMIAMMGKTYAANSFSASLTPNTSRVSKGQEVKLTLKISRINVEGGITELTGMLDFNEDVLSISKDDIKELNDWSITYNEDNGKISFEKQSPVEEDEEVATFTFKVAENTHESTATIKLRDVEGGNSSLEDNVSISQITQTITISSGGGLGETTQPSITTLTPSIAPTTTTTITPSVSPTTTTTTTPTSTTKNETMPDTGAEQSYVLPLVAAIAVLGILAFINYKKLDK